LLQAIAELPEAAVHRGLAHLQAAEFLYETRLFPERAYTFKHALTQQVAYQSLLTSTRQRYHAQLAQALEARSETVETQPELLAHHCAEAGLAEQAVGYWQRAGQRTIERSANLEAISHFTRGLEVLNTLPDHRRARSARAALTDCSGLDMHLCEGYGGLGSGTGLCTGARAMPAGGRHPAAYPGAAGIASVLFCVRRVPAGA